MNANTATTFLLRTANADDVEDVRSLTCEAYSKWVPVIGREPLPMTADYDEAVRKHRIDLLHVDGKLAGLIEMIPSEGYLLIENVAVSTVFQNRGLGQKLLAHAEHVATAQGYPEIKLFTNKLFAENVQLYSKVGYRVDREEEILARDHRLHEQDYLT